MILLRLLRYWQVRLAVGLAALLAFNGWFLLTLECAEDACLKDPRSTLAPLFLSPVVVLIFLFAPVSFFWQERVGKQSGKPKKQWPFNEPGA